MKVFVLIFVVAAMAAIGYGVLHKQAKPQTITETKSETPQISFREIDFTKINPSFRFSAKVPQGLEVGSDIFITTFQASQFLKLKTVDIYREEKTTLNGHDAVIYEIEKKPDAPNFVNQPSWRNERHTAIDIRFSKNNPTIFYSFAFRPGVEQSTIDSFLDSLIFHEPPFTGKYWNTHEKGGKRYCINSLWLELERS